MTYQLTAKDEIAQAVDALWVDACRSGVFGDYPSVGSSLETLREAIEGLVRLFAESTPSPELLKVLAGVDQQMQDDGPKVCHSLDLIPRFADFDIGGYVDKRDCIHKDLQELIERLSGGE